MQAAFPGPQIERSWTGQVTTWMVISSGITLLLASLVFITHDLTLQQNTSAQSLTAVARITAVHSRAVLAFEQPVAATELLDSLRQYEAIDAAALFLADGRRLASYQRDPSAPDMQHCPAIKGHAFHGSMWSGRGLDLVVPIEERGERLGAIYLHARTGLLNGRVTDYLGIAAVVLMLSLLCTSLLGSVGQRFMLAADAVVRHATRDPLSVCIDHTAPAETPSDGRRNSARRRAA